MEQDDIAGLYQSLGVPVGEEFTSEDVSLLYSKVFHFPSNTTEAYTAMKKVAGGESRWSCTAENVLDVLLEMEREREKKEMLYWDLQLLNNGNLNPLHNMLDCLFQNPNTFKKAYNSGGSLQPCTFQMDGIQMGRWVGGKELCGKKTSVKRLKKAGRHCWARLASEGVQSILPYKWQSQRQGIRDQAWGYVSLSDVLLLVDVKYDVVSHLLCTEMLQEHHTKSVWEALLPLQQNLEIERLEEHVEKALAAADMLSLAELPGAFRIYKAYLGASFRSCAESMEKSWSAVLLLNELRTFRKQEQDTLTVLGDRLHGESLRLLCLYIRLATLKAQREKMSYSALLAAQQSWERWPQVNSLCRMEQAGVWLHSEEEEKEDDFKTVEQLSLLQLLVLTQEQERKHLVALIHGISTEDLQASICTVPTTDDNHHQVALRNGCINRLRQIHARLLKHHGTQPQVQAHENWSQLLLEDCALLLMTHLMELQEVQAYDLLQAMMDENAQCVQGLRDKYESEIQAQRFTNLLHLLISDFPLASDTMLIPSTKWIENGSNRHIIVQSSYTGEAEVQNINGGSAEAKTANSNQRPNRVLNEVQTADGTSKQDICSGCGAMMEELPYLEILYVSDAHEGLTAEGGAQEQEEGSSTKSSQSYEKQGSLITLAWSKPPQNETDNVAEAADGSTGQIQDATSNMKTQVHPTQCDKSARDREHLKPSANQQRTPVEQLTSNNRAAADQPNEGEAVSECDLEVHAFISENQESSQPQPMADSCETSPHVNDLSSGTCNDTANAARNMAEVETESEQQDPKGPENQRYSPEATVDCSLSECKAKKEPTLIDRERVTEPVSAMERERTMRNLVDMQRKVERRQQRDRERQMLRVQERLSIIQNRKAEEDLLGLKHTDRIRHLTQDLPLEDKNQQKTVVKERLEQLRRERSYVMQSKRDRNTAGFKELLVPVALQSREMEDGED